MEMREAYGYRQVVAKNIPAFVSDAQVVPTPSDVVTTAIHLCDIDPPVDT